jgi:hypothetical protein
MRLSFRDLNRSREITALQQLWSGRQESKSQPTAWKAATPPPLPLGYPRSSLATAIMDDPSRLSPDFPGSRVEAWQEELGVQEQRVTVAPSGKTEVAFTFKGE